MTTYRYALEIFSEHGQSLGQYPVTPDWEPALECVAFEAMRRGRFPAVVGLPPGTVEPLWDSEHAAPYVAGFRAIARGADGVTVASTIPNAFLRTEARKLSAVLVEAGKLEKGDLFTYLVCAYAIDEAASRSAADDLFTIEDVPQPLPLETTPIERFLGAAAPSGDDTDATLPVFIPRYVLDEAIALSREAKDVETGGVLIGKLHRDENSSEIFAEITAQIPASHAVSQATKLTFTAETWAAVDAARALRRRDEMMLGWWHFHPDFCAKCPEETRRTCQMTSTFFSADDVHLHRTVFGRPYQVGLLISENKNTEMTSSLFGWRRGVVEARHFHVVQAP